VPCGGGVPRLKTRAIKKLSAEVPEWKVVKERWLRRRYDFRNFRDALAFVRRVARVAETEGHHPDVSFGWGYCELTIYTHAVGGLTESDFVLAAKIDRL
jgi:4a-hydroxytetrahydrobiopterin dehydratase